MTPFRSPQKFKIHKFLSIKTTNNKLNFIEIIKNQNTFIGLCHSMT